MSPLSLWPDVLAFEKQPWFAQASSQQFLMVDDAVGEI
jgi:hypothetical protein